MFSCLRWQLYFLLLQNIRISGKCFVITKDHNSTLVLKIRHIFGRWILGRWNKYKEGRKGKKNIFILVKNIEWSEYLYTTSKKLKAFLVWIEKKMDYEKRLYRKINIPFYVSWYALLCHAGCNSKHVSLRRSTFCHLHQLSSFVSQQMCLMSHYSNKDITIGFCV